jgi:hypothetical protein
MASFPQELTPRRHPLPAWAMSLALHFVLFMSVALTMRFSPRGADLGPDREAGIVLVHEGDSQREYTDPSTDSPSPSTPSFHQALPQLDEVPVELPGTELSPEDLVGASQVAAASQESGDGTGSAQLSGPPGTTRLNVFGITGTGSKFVFVFDRSGSMDGYGGAPLRAAKTELRRGIEQLDRIHQFQIIFYNEKPHIFRPKPGPPQMIWGDDQSKQLAVRFIDQMTAGGGTQHLDALQLALGMSPDVIFFLTDADEPRLSDADLRRVQRWNKQSTLHTIEFGHGRQSDGRNFLVKLAEQNGGQHAYVDVSRL